MRNIAVIVGTRPEAIKLIPVYRKLCESHQFSATFISTGQHKELVDSAYNAFSFQPDIDLALMTPGQSLADISSSIIRELNKVFLSHKFDGIIVQGDTNTTFSAALVAHFHRLTVAHVEAGLRTGDKWSPFPEEAFRRMVAPIADYHFAATKEAVSALRLENIFNNVVLTGNTVIDSLFYMKGIIEDNIQKYDRVFDNVISLNKKNILITCHRRESFGEGIKNICKTIRRISENHDEINIVFVAHLNPIVRKSVSEILNGAPNIHLIEPQPYDAMVYLMMRSWLIMTDSGGIQEEAPSLDVPVLVMREKSERTEGIAQGCAMLTGTSSSGIMKGFRRIYDDPSYYRLMANAKNPYGDGKACDRILKYLLENGET